MLRIGRSDGAGKGGKIVRFYYDIDPMELGGCIIWDFYYDDAPMELKKWVRLSESISLSE